MHDWRDAKIRNAGAGTQDPDFDDAARRFAQRRVTVGGTTWWCMGLVRTPRSLREGPGMALSQLGRAMWFGRVYLLLLGDDGAQLVSTVHGVHTVAPAQAENRPV